MLYRFANEMQKGSTVVTYDPSTRLYHIGDVTSDCIPATEALLDNGECYVRTISWKHEVSRDLLDKSTKNRLGSIATLFSVSTSVLNDLLKAAKAPTTGNPTPNPTDTSEDDDSDSTLISEDEAIERIKDRVRQLTWEEMELLIAGMLRSMGYKTHLTQKGADGGRDLIASPTGSARHSRGLWPRSSIGSQFGSAYASRAAFWAEKSRSCTSWPIRSATTP